MKKPLLSCVSDILSFKTGKQGNRGILRAPLGSTPKDDPPGCVHILWGVFPGSRYKPRPENCPLPDSGATHLRQKFPKPDASSLTNPHRPNFFVGFFFRLKKNLQQFSKKFPGKHFRTRGRNSRTISKLTAMKKMPARLFKKNFPATSQAKPGFAYPIIASHTQ
jgi:hypothetical protein